MQNLRTTARRRYRNNSYFFPIMIISFLSSIKAYPFLTGNHYDTVAPATSSTAI
jgi:hypothetical protein